MTPRWERVLFCQAGAQQWLRAEKMVRNPVRHRRSSCVRGWIEVEGALVELVQLGVSRELGEADPPRGKVARDLLIQVVQEAATVLPHCGPT